MLAKAGLLLAYVSRKMSRPSGSSTAPDRALTLEKKLVRAWFWVVPETH